MRIITLLLLGCFALCCCAQSETSSSATMAPGEASAFDRMLPAVAADQTVVSHAAFSLVYSERDEQPLWVAYMLTRERANGKNPRADNFREDRDIATGSASLEDYRRSGYSRGHLCPAGDMKWDPVAMDETFLLSNMSPQLYDFNDGVWNRVENQVRGWARRYDTLFIVTGPVLKDAPSEQIGPNCVTVPTAFYKAIYDPHRKQAIAFLVPHEQSDKPVKAFILSVDELEKVTGIDFFPELPDELEDKVESECCASCWQLR